MSSNAQEDTDKSKDTSASSAENKSRIVPQASIVTTSPQKGMLKTSEAFPQNESDRESVSTNGYLRQILQAAKPGGSNVFLVDATNAHDAVRASFSALVGARSTDTPVPVNIPNPIRGSHWLVAYLGSGPSNPTWWTFDNVTVRQNKVRLTYRKTTSPLATRDAKPYYFWIPLGTLDRGAYELELYDAETGVVTLMRRVEVESLTQKETAK